MLYIFLHVFILSIKMQCFVVHCYFHLITFETTEYTIQVLLISSHFFDDKFVLNLRIKQNLENKTNFIGL